MQAEYVVSYINLPLSRKRRFISDSFENVGSTVSEAGAISIADALADTTNNGGGGMVEAFNSSLDFRIVAIRYVRETGDYL